MLQVVSPLLAFDADPQLEATFEQRFHTRCLVFDQTVFAAIATLNLALVALKMVTHGRWGTVALLVLEAAVAAACMAWHRTRSESYLRHRSRTIALVSVCHALVSRGGGGTGA